jgi:hypothetical protein
MGPHACYLLQLSGMYALVYSQCNIECAFIGIIDCNSQQAQLSLRVSVMHDSACLHWLATHAWFVDRTVGTEC